MKNIKLSDYLADYLLKKNLRYIYSVTGAGSMHFNDSIGSKKGLEVYYTHHEQAAAMAAEGTARITGLPAVVNVSTGPGGTNALTGVAGAWVDSIPMIVVSGQIMRKDRGKPYGLRQMGVQEIDTISLAKPITKYAVTVEDPLMIKYHLDKALHLSLTGKPGPVWIEIPLDVQSTFINPKLLKQFKPTREKKFKIPIKKIKQSIKLIEKSEKPLIISGYGVRISNSKNLLLKLIKKTKIPLCPSWNTIDLINSDSEYVIGRAGLFGDRPSNYAVQKCDLLIVLGSRLSTAQIGYMDDLYAKNAKIIYVEIDKKEINKPTVRSHLKINCNVKDYLKILTKKNIQVDSNSISKWREKLLYLKSKYPVVKEYVNKHKNYASSFQFIHDLSKILKNDDCVVTDMGTSFTCTMQSFQAKSNQRLWTSSGLASMGYGLPAAIGASIGRGNKRVICITGDGGMLFNLQELQTVKHYNIPIKIFLIDNEGYLTQKLMMEKNFKRYAGAHPKSGVSCPDFLKVAKSFDFKCELINNDKTMPKKIKKILHSNKSSFCVIKIHPMQPLTPRVLMKMRKDGTFERTGIESVSPFLPEDEHQSNLKLLN